MPVHLCLAVPSYIASYMTNRHKCLQNQMQILSKLKKSIFQIECRSLESENTLDENCDF